MELLLWPIGILFAIYEDSGWKGALSFFVFFVLFIGCCILMGIDAFHGIGSPFDPRSAFITKIPWFNLFLILLFAVTAKALGLAFLKAKKKKTKLGEIS